MATLAIVMIGFGVGVICTGGKLLHRLHISGRDLKHAGLCMKSNLTKKEYKWKIKYEKHEAKKQAKRWRKEQAWIDDQENPANQ